MYVMHHYLSCVNSLYSMKLPYASVVPSVGWLVVVKGCPKRGGGVSLACPYRSSCFNIATRVDFNVYLLPSIPDLPCYPTSFHLTFPPVLITCVF